MGTVEAIARSSSGGLLSTTLQLQLHGRNYKEFSCLKRYRRNQNVTDREEDAVLLKRCIRIFVRAIRGSLYRNKRSFILLVHTKVHGLVQVKATSNAWFVSRLVMTYMGFVRP